MTATLTIARSSLELRAIESSLTGLAETSRRVYSAQLQRFMQWSEGAALSRELVKKYIRALELQGASAQVRNQALAAIKRLAREASDLGWIDHDTGARIGTIGSKRSAGTKTGKWLTAAQCKHLIELPDRSTVIGRRDACVLALLLGCGLRRAEACALETAQIRQMPGDAQRLLVANLLGKGGRVRSIAVPRWAAHDIKVWLKEVTGKGVENQ